MLRLGSLLLLLPGILLARKVPEEVFDIPDLGLPWFTGPLLSPSGLTIPPGHFNIEPYFYVIANVGSYDNDWSAQKDEHIFFNNSLQVSTQIGILSWLDVQFSPTVYYNRTDGASCWALGDFPFGFDIQLYRADKDEWLPNIKLVIQESFPTGKYHKLNPKKKGTDAGGTGSFITGVGLAFAKQIHLAGEHFMTTRFGCRGTFPTTVRVKGLNAYGGGETTDGTLKPAQSLQMALGFEANVTRNWVLALDIVGIWAKGSNFSGDPGFDENNELAEIGSEPLIQYSMAPAIEYNWNANIGIIAGSWFTIAGKNAVQFYSGGR